MCVQVNVRGEWVDTVGDLRAALGCEVQANRFCPDRPEFSEWCLCLVDMPATLDAAGVGWVLDHAGDYHVL